VDVEDDAMREVDCIERAAQGLDPERRHEREGTRPSFREWLHNRTNTRGSSIRKATEKRTAASAATGIRPMNGANATTARTSASAWTITARRVLAPACTFVAERAMTPVTGMPPKTALAMLPRPCPISS
jgi:hypothetical protein